jgi:predicted kinase
VTVLVVLAGLPGSGKSTLARPLARQLRAALVVVDLLEDAMLRAGLPAGEPTGLAAYLAAEVVAGDALAAHVPVVVDAVNAVAPAREQWRALAAHRGVPRAVVEVVCSDPVIHRARLEGRSRGLALREPTWADVRARDYEPWTEPVLRLDSLDDAEANLGAALLHVLAASPGGSGKPLS